MQIRFDDLRPGHRHSFGFVDPIEVLTTDSAAGVAEVVAAAEGRAAAGRWVAGFLSYEAAPGLDPVLATHPPARGFPVAWFAVFESRLVDPPWPESLPFSLGEWESQTDRAAHRDALDSIHRSIAAGDTYQVNHTMRLRGRFTGDAVSAYQALVRAQSGGFGAFLDIDDHLVLSASPELFFAWDENGITTRPMKGTIARGRWPEEDEAHRRDLIDSHKDRAENLMIVDLLRNDLGRIAEYGSVEVTDLFGMERFDTVWQMTSTIRAQPRPGVSLLDVLTGLFPSGSITGAPKARTMEIIRKLEASPRGLYCGAIGLLAPPGSGEPRAQFNVAIRTVVIDSASGDAEYGTGGGITWDSVATSEYDEALVKAAVLTHQPPGFSLLETMLWGPGEGIARWGRHLSRLQASADYFGFTVPSDLGVVLGEINAEEAQRVRLVLSREGEVGVQVEPLEIPDGPVRVAVDSERVDSQDTFLFHKTTHREVYEAAAGRFPKADDVILVNENDMATETTRANLAVRLGDTWVTPPLDDGCLPGTYRAELVDAGTLREQSVPRSSLLEADGLAVVSSLRGWLAAELIRPQ
ncbi:MAG: aminodeoxychorismate synthase component I [Acidimicrobiia bacterium]|nr:aminodeoxychorismate synthase component I [Acidimicrobiia bacterium]